MTSVIDTNAALLPGLPGKSALEKRNARASHQPNYPTTYGRTATAGWLVILTAFGGLAAWSVFAPLSTAAIASGTVVVDSFRKSVQHLQGGIIQDILVRDGQHEAARR